jgi:hypothetical protein
LTHFENSTIEKALRNYLDPELDHMINRMKLKGKRNTNVPDNITESWYAYLKEFYRLRISQALGILDYLKG